MKVLIVDDEPPARERLRRQLSELGDCETVGEAGSGEEAIRLCEHGEADVVLMDIRMPGMGGLEAARRIAGMAEAPAVIFTTAYDEYALDAFSASPADYLVKPVRREHLARALQRATRTTRAQLAALPSAASAAAPTPAAPAGEKADARGRSAISARTGDTMTLVPVDSIVAFCADNKYTSVVHQRGEVLIDESLKSLEQEFAHAFVRVHRETLVSLQHIVALERDRDGQHHVRLALDPEHEVRYRVSRRHAAAVKKRLRQL
jgi:two-component system response regulator AlgR